MTSVLYARSTDPITSFEAAMHADLNGSESWVFLYLRAHGPMPDAQLEAAGADKWSAQRIRTARSSLVRHGLVRHNGEYALTRFGRRTQIWEAL